MRNTFIVMMLIFFSLAYSCKEPEVLVDRVTSVSYQYVNITNYSIDMFVYSSDTLVEKYNIAASDTLLLKYLGMGFPLPFGYKRPLSYFYADSICVRFADMKYLTYTKGDSIFDAQKCELIEISEYAYNCFYYFDNTDFERAKPIIN